MKRISLLASLIAFFSLSVTSALAFHCPADMAKIDAALAKNPKVSTAQLAEVKIQRTEGEALHKAGKHADSVAILSKAMKTLGI